ncbi:MAG: alpha/beta hydrolase [Gemmatimonadetes bacterium]|nr:alpha/beta hydrolase [Gemmatimonadota bacterium]
MPSLRSLAIAIAAALPWSTSAQSRFDHATRIGRVDSLHSAHLKEQRPYLVYTPPSYSDTTATPQHYPVLYLLDGDAHFHSVTGLIQILGTGVNGTYVLPEMIVVAIPNTRDRLRDMTPTRTTVGFGGTAMPGLETSGGMPAFLSFIRDELIPQVERGYRTLPFRVFVGHSLGGITAIQALYTMPELFHAYVAIDPSLWWDNTLLLRQAKARMAAANWAGRALYVAQANTLSPDDSVTNPHFGAITQFDAQLKAYKPAGFRYAFKYYEHDDHGSVPLVAEYDALRFIFDGYKLNLPRTLAAPRTVVTHFQDVSAKLGVTFTPSEGALRLLGSVAMGQDATKSAEFHRMATELYPRSWRAWDNLGVAALAAKDTVGARRAWEESLRLNAGNAALRDRLSALRR